ncbi:unnamed protein product [Somion occarium]|uniref:F-box domain-containing protein n=1 Tax=Somion occarium TaxID=3059160 RepID=A0ABP1DP22_9APHY
MLPQELIEYILDDLSDDLPSVKTSSLVCRAWRPRSQYHIHNTITLCRKSDVSALSDRFASSPMIAGYVRCVKMDFSRLTKEFWDKALPLLHHLPNINSVAFVSVDMCIIPTNVQSFLAEHCSTLKALSLYNVVLSNFGAFAMLLNCFPHLLHLNVQNVYWGGYRNTPIPSRLPILRSLSLAYCTEQTVLMDWLLSEDDDIVKSSLFTLEVIWNEDPADARRILRSVGSSVQNLVFLCIPSGKYVSGDTAEQIGPLWIRTPSSSQEYSECRIQMDRHAHDARRQIAINLEHHQVKLYSFDQVIPPSLYRGFISRSELGSR